MKVVINDPETAIELTQLITYIKMADFIKQKLTEGVYNCGKRK